MVETGRVTAFEGKWISEYCREPMTSILCSTLSSLELILCGRGNCSKHE
jgi:hypothetical protein